MSLTLGERLKKLRENKGLLQEDTAKYLKVTQKTISNYEKNERKPDPDTLKQLAIFYGVTSDYLIGKSDDQNEIKLSPLEKFIGDYAGLSKEDKKEAIKRLVDQALENNNK
jgi:transcriptional regulator with XRE-family HTH domain